MRRYLGIGSIVALLTAGVALAPATVAAQDGGDEAAERESAEAQSEPTPEEKEKFAEFVQAGKDAYTGGKFKKAIPFFEQAYKIIPRPELKYRLALCYERSNQPAKALLHYREFLEEKPDTERRGAVEQTIAELEEKVEKASKATLRIESTPPAARVFVTSEGGEQEEEARGETPLEMTVSGGKLQVTIEKEGYQAKKRTLEVEAGETTTYSFELTPVQTDDAGRAEGPSGGGMSAGTTAALIVGSVGVVGGGTFYGVGQHCSQVSNNKKNCSRGLYNGSVISSYIGGGLGVAGLGTAAVIWMTGGHESNRQAAADSRTPLRLYVSPQSIGIAGQF